MTMKFTIALLAGLLPTGSAFAQQKEQRVFDFGERLDRVRK